ncbi:MAG: C4-dicarboxylate TRAP transporter substrate-binding protein [Planctomycetota bacterium]|jgi:tripartite ATP-independent transporter DctP family solute receptor|nr:C4-dicarboxylate TRAP transporter substrate-binding protein [Planctomycetota bacterium]
MRKCAKVLAAWLALALLPGLAATAPAGQVVIQLGYENHPGEPVDLACREWARLLELESGGAMKMDVYPSSQLGSKNDIIDQMIAGDSVITLADGAFYADRGVPDFNIVFAPYLIDSWEACWRLVDSDWYKEQVAKLEKMGVKILTSKWIYGDRHTLAKRPIRTVADIKGMKIRVPNNAMQIAGFEVLGAAPAPMPLGEVYTALQQGVIDGLENPLQVLYNGKFQEVAKYLTLDGHVRNFCVWACGTVFFDGLSPEQQKLLVSTGDKAGLFNNGIVLKAGEETIAKFKAEGVEIIEVDIEEFKKAAEPIYQNPAIIARWTPGLVDRVKAAMK